MALFALGAAQAPPELDEPAPEYEPDRPDAASPAVRDPGSEPPVAADPPPAPDPEEGPVVVAPPGAIDPSSEAERERAADEAYARCLVLRERGPGPEVTACFESVLERYRGTEAAGRASGALDVLGGPLAPAEQPPPGALDAPEPEVPTELGLLGEMTLPEFLAPGRLELAFVSGVLGVWAGASAGILAGTNADQMHLRLEPWTIVLGTGATAVGAGLVGATTGYFVADGFDLDQGDVWSFTAGTTWGTSYAISLVPAVYDLVDVPWYVQDELVVLTPLLGAGLGAASGLGLGLALDPSIAEVSIMNTGGWVSGALGMLIGLNIASWTDGQYKPSLTTALTYSGLKTAGLLAGAAVSRFVDLTWGETLLGDFGAVLGAIALGSAAMAFLISPAADPTFQALGLTGVDQGKASFTLATTSLGLGLVGGLGAAGVGLSAWHAFHDRPILRLDRLPFALEVGPPAVAVDMKQQAVVGPPTLRVRW